MEVQFDKAMVQAIAIYINLDQFAITDIGAFAIEYSLPTYWSR